MREYRNVEREAVKGSSNKVFGIVLCIFFAVIGLMPLIHGGAFRIWALACSAILGFLALMLPGSLSLLNKIWTRFGLLLHTITTPLIMGLVFFGVVTPMGLIMRLFGKRPLALKYSDRPSCWIERKTAPDPESFKHQF